MKDCQKIFLPIFASALTCVSTLMELFLKYFVDNARHGVSIKSSSFCSYKEWCDK